jgi:hypothetical protein
VEGAEALAECDAEPAATWPLPGFFGAGFAGFLSPFFAFFAGFAVCFVWEPAASAEPPEMGATSAVKPNASAASTPPRRLEVRARRGSGVSFARVTGGL